MLWVMNTTVFCVLSQSSSRSIRICSRVSASSAPKLRQLDNVVLLPHMSSATIEGRLDMGEKVLINIKTFVDGHRQPDRVLPNHLQEPRPPCSVLGLQEQSIVRGYGRTGMTYSWEALTKILISAVIIVILATQAVAGFIDPGKWGWPMIAYPMYKKAHFEGERLNHDVNVYAQLSDGTRTEINRNDLGMDFWIFHYNVVGPIGQGRSEPLAPLVQRYCRESDNQLIKFQVEDKGVAIGRDGPIEGLPPQLVSEIAVACN
jgi:hypothetical protein